MPSRLRRVLAEAIKFLAVGGVATIVAVLLFNLMVHWLPAGADAPLHDNPLSAYIIANTIGMAISYRGARSWAFRKRQVVGTAGGRLSYVIWNVISMLIPLACLTISRYALGLESGLADNLSANVIGLALGMAFRFWAFRRFVFVNPNRVHRDKSASAASSSHDNPKPG